MDTLSLCWAFDRRWVFGIQFQPYMIWVPVIIDLITLIAYAFEENMPNCCNSKSNQAILASIILGHVWLMGASYYKTLRMKGNVYRNKENIDRFILE